jgi:hypothetical protein
VESGPLPGRLSVDDLGYPAWIPGWLFTITDPSLPADWICQVLHEELELVMGPDFIAKDESAYGTMVDLASDQVERFWKRVDGLRADELDERE